MTLLLIIGSLIFLVLLSFGLEALRRHPTAPQHGDICRGEPPRAAPI